MFGFSKRTSKKIAKGLHGLVTLVSSASIVAGSVTSSFAQQIIVDPSAPGTSFLQTSNGTPQVNIATPQGGVSLNQFETFNVDRNGLVLNNSTTGGVSVIGQNVTANPNLMVSGPASTIVNEVTSAAPSTLTGTTEVFGQSAAVVVANPNGITCNGCAFLNSTSSTLTTGKPIINGSRVDLLVTKGTVTIGPDGFDAGRQAGVFGRHVIVDGPIATAGQAARNDLVVSGGSQRVRNLNFDRLSQTTIVGAPSTVARTSPFAIDASERGTLTGGTVVLRAPEAGQGANIYGKVDARSLSAQSAGDLFYKDIKAVGRVALNGSDVRQYGDLTTRGNAVVGASSFTLYDGRVIETPGDVDLNASGFAVIAGEVSGGDVSVTVNSGSLTNTGFLMADGELTILAENSFRQQRDIAREYDIYFDPALQQYLQAYSAQLIAGGSKADIAAQMITRAGRHEIVAEYIDKGATTTGTNVTITARDGDISNKGGAIAATSDVRLTAGADIINTYLALRSRLGAQDGCSAENCGYRTDFHAGEILAGNDLDLVAGRDIRNEASAIAAARNVTLDATRDVVNALSRSSHEATEDTAISVRGPVLTCRSGGKHGGGCRLSTGTYTATDRDINEGNVLAPARIASLYGKVTVEADRDFVSKGSEITSGTDLTINAKRAVTMTSYTDAEGHYTDRIRNATRRTCTGGKDGSCSTRLFQQTTREDGTVLVTATSNLAGRSVSVTSGRDLKLIGARILASDDLSLKSTRGSVLIDANDLPGVISPDGLETPKLVELSDDLATQIFGPATGGRAGAVAESTADYIAFLKDNELLTATEALRRASGGAAIKGAAREVGAQSYLSLIDSSRLNSLRREAQAAVDAVHARSGADLADHDAEVAAYHEDFRGALQAIEDRLDLSGQQRTAQINAALQTVTTEYQARRAAAQRAYDQALAANQAQYGHLLTRREYRTRTVGRGKNATQQRYFVTVPNTHYVNLKNAADGRAQADRRSALAAAESRRQLEATRVRASFTQAGVAAEIRELEARFNTRLNSFADRKAGLLTRYGTQVSDALRQAETVLQQEAVEEAVRNRAIARGTVAKGQASLAAALTDQAFPELAVVQDIVTNRAGVVQNRRDGNQPRTRLVTRARDIGEYQESIRIVRQPRHTQSCSGSGKNRSCRTVTTHVNVEVPETNWVITGTEDYLVEQTYFDGIASRAALLSSDKSKQDEFLAATAWRFATQDARKVQSPRNRLVSQSDLSITAQQGALLGQGSFEAFGRLNVSAFGGVTAKSADLSASQINLSAGSNVKGYGVGLDAVDDINITAAGAVEIAGLGRTYTNATGFKHVIGTLKGVNWADQRGAGNWGGAGNRIMVSQELSNITSGSDLNITGLGDITLGGVTVQTEGNVFLNTRAKLALTAPRSVIESHAGNSRNGTDLWDIRSHVTDITTGGNFSALAGDTASLEGTRIDAGGTLDLAATNDVTISAAQNIYEYSHRTYSSSLFKKRSSSLSITRLVHDGADLVSRGTMGIESETGNLITAGSRFESRAGDINLSATKGDILAGAFTDIDRQQAQYSKSSFFGLISSSGNSLVDHRNATGTSALADLDLTIVSGGDTELVGATLSAGRNLNLDVGGDLRVLAAINSEREEFFESRMGAVLATTKTERSLKESAVLTSLNANGELSISVGGKTFVTLYSREGEDGQSAAELYPEELTALANLVLLDETLLDEYFYDETKSLSPAFTAVLSIALTQGFGSIIANSGIAGLVQGGQLTNAGKAIAAFASSSTVGLANGAVSGDLDLGEILRNAALSAGTQFLTASINLRVAGDTAGADRLSDAADAANSAADGFGNQTYALLGGSWDQSFSTPVFGNNLTVANALEGAFDASISAGLSSAVTGSDFREGLTTSFVRSVVALGLADAQNQIGNIFQDGANGGEGSFGHVLLHGLAGCAAAEASGADCGAGAAAGVTQAIYAGTLGGLTQEERLDAAQTAELLGAFAGYVFSGGDPENISNAATIAQSGLVNNYLNHDERSEVMDLIAERNRLCGGSGIGPGPSCEQTNSRVADIDARLVQLKSVSAQRTRQLINKCSQGPSSLCNSMLLEAEAFNAWTRESWNYDYRDGFSSGGDLIFEGGDFGSLFDLDDAVVEVYGKMQRGETNADQAAIDLVAEIARFDGRIKLVAGAIEVAGVTVCAVGSGGACALAVAGAVVGANTASEGLLEIVTGQNQLSPAEAGLVAAGVDGATAEQIIDWVEAGVAVVTVVGGTKLVTDAAGKMLGSVPRVAPNNLLDVPGRVQSRVNLANGSTRFTPLNDAGNPVQSGWGHVTNRHFGGNNTQSQFTLSQSEVRGILQSDRVVSAPVSEIKMINGTPTYVRTVDVGRPIGTVRQSNGGGTTTNLYVQTDSAGNLITAFPVP